VEVAGANGAAFRRRMILGLSVLSVPTTALMVAYLVALVRMPPEHLRIFWQNILGMSAVIFPLLALDFGRYYTQIGRAIDRLDAGTASREELAHAFRTATALPRLLFVRGSLGFIVIASLVVGLTVFRAQDFPHTSALALLACMLSGGFALYVFSALGAKRLAEPERLRLAAALGSADEREGFVARLGLASKLRVALVGVTLVTAMFAILLSQSRASQAVEALASRLQAHLLERAGEAPGAAELDELRTEARALGLASELLVLPPGSAGHAATGAALARIERDAIADSKAELGDGTGFDSPHAFAWRRLADGRVLVLSSPPAALRPDAAQTRLLFAVALLASALISWGLAFGLSDDVSRATRALRGQAEAVAAGDLRCEHPFDAEDELGALARDFERATRALAGIVRGLADTADRVEGAARAIALGGDAVAGATAGQLTALGHASDAMARVKSGVAGIASSAQGLTRAVDESASSVHELDAVGAELSRTATGLSTKVDTVSSAVEQMAASVREVARSADHLAAGASETSSSMEEMAASVREVESHAAEAAALSARVVGAAEQGSERVAQTIAGMQAIRRETDAAREVIARLGERVGEIGGILEVIDSVADETNLLALNAAIISAQAGESGRAFAVVASQIKALANRVLSSTREIEARVRAVQEESKNATAAMERGAASVKSGVALSAEAGASLDEITGAARQSGQRIEEIVGAMREQTKAAAHVVQLMDDLQAGVERIRRASQEQDRGNVLILNEAVDMRGASQRVSATAQEQQAGSARIRDAFEGVRVAVADISTALLEQSDACTRAAELMEAMRARTGESREAVEGMAEATRGLGRDADALRDHVRRFRV
jgi:methyl-accepting chemotaxis protein